jgi:hypothetical protein
MTAHNYSQGSPISRASHVNMIEGSSCYLKPNERSKQDLNMQYCRRNFISHELLNNVKIHCNKCL